MEAGGLGKLELGQHEQGILGNWFRETVWLILIATKVEAETKKKLRNCQILIKSWPLGANHYRVILWLPGLFAKNSGLTTYRPNLETVVCLSELVIVDRGRVS